MRVLNITLEEFKEGCDEYYGVCLACGEIQIDTCEPDARNYRCEVCGEKQVFGFSEALSMGVIQLK